MQVRPLHLKDMDISDRLTHFLEDCDRINSMLGNKSRLNSQALSTSLKRLHESLRMKIKRCKHNGLARLMLNHLYEVMPTRRSQLAVLPSLWIGASGAHSFHVPLQLRDGSRPYQVK